ncbi:peptide deformylase [Pseudactinotalea sp. HY158]|uniref:peptide deformylase n=1 Tax=Pseudactinotalea sp. HY158 TaxID=2654547 RepID=UPI00129C9CD7|nr:peptide deformylase [Pseudactinotalea sp. HY158]QGH69067.1 peptide deformylase [Pseudactinotalea sp. HY158]
MSIRTIVQGDEVDDYPLLPPEAARGTALRVTEVGEGVLHEPCRTITEFDTPELHTLIDDMFATMAVAEGVGLAANQVGVDLRLFVYDLTHAEVRHVGHVLNPVVVIEEEAGTEESEEGCLSVPGPGAELFRGSRATVTGVDVYGEPVTITGEGYFARCLQHETDHLGGRLYIDLISKRERKRVLADMSDLREEVLERRTELAAELGKAAPTYPDAPPAR